MTRRARWLDRTLVACPMHLMLCLHVEDLHAACRHFGIPKADFPGFLKNEDSDATVHYFENMRKAAAVVCLANVSGKTYAQIAALLAHEAMHIWQRTLDYLGETAPGHELEAYSVQNITQTLLEDYERQTQ